MPQECTDGPGNRVWFCPRKLAKSASSRVRTKPMATWFCFSRMLPHATSRAAAAPTMAAAARPNSTGTVSPGTPSRLLDS